MKKGQPALVYSNQIQVMKQKQEDQIKITFVESPINQITSDIITSIEDKLASNLTQTNNFALISKRLEQNIKRIGQMQSQSKNPKRFNNFKEIKHSIISRDAEQKRKEIISNIPNYGDEMAINQSQRTFGHINYKTNTVIQKTIQNRKPIVQRVLYEEQPNKQSNVENKQLNASNSSSSLANCLKQIKEVKQTIKNLKERCQNGYTEQKRKQPLEVQYRTSSNRKKYLSHSGQKYNYTNYHDLSQRKLNELSQRKQRSQKTFNWIRNPVAIKEFTICTNQDQNKTIAF